MKYLALLIYLILITLIIEGYSAIFDIALNGSTWGVIGYKVLWGINGIGVAYFYDWIIG
jgi:hypothetical protein